jgi:hypothetical protein
VSGSTRIKQAAVVMLGTWSLWSSPVHAKPFDCSKNCGLPAKFPYPNIIVGVIDGVADEAQTKKIFTWARSHGYWKNLPPESDKFWKYNQTVSVNVKGKYSITVLTMQSEAQAAPFKIGDWARFAPHRSDRDKPAADDLDGLKYWATGGCVQILCRGDKSICDGHYVQGLYQLNDGTALKDDGKTPDPEVRAIDTHSMLPK